jgi:ketosteroid isomerase-like protein
MKETWQEAAIAERVNDWLAAFSPGNKPFDFSVLDNLYWQDEQLLAFDTLSPQTTRIQGWKSFEEIWKPFMSALAQWQIKPVGDIRILTGDKLAIAALIFHGIGTTTKSEPVDIMAHATLVWEKRGEQWRIIHEHISNPVK